MRSRSGVANDEPRLLKPDPATPAKEGDFVTRPLSVLLLGILLVPLGACQTLAPGGAGSQPDRLARILDSGELRVGISADLPPLNMKSKAGEIVGFEVDLVEALAHAMGLEARLVEVPFAKLIPSLEAGDVDLVISGMTITPERNARVAFVGPYFISGTSVLARSKTITEVDYTDDLDKPGRTYAALEGSTSAQFVEEVLSQSKLLTVSDYDTGTRMVIDGDADAMVADHLACKYAIWSYPEAGLSAMRTPFTVEPLGIALPPDAPLLLNLVENYLRTLESTGLLMQFKAKWLADGSWMEDLP